MIQRTLLALSLILALSGAPQAAHAADASSTSNGGLSFGDAALTVVVATAAGTILGASTLPFYSNSSDHTKNIFYGAALGAVVGVMFCAYAAVKDGGAAYDDARLLTPPKQQPRLAADWAISEKISAARTSALRGMSAQKTNSVMAWSPITEFRF